MGDVRYETPNMPTIGAVTGGIPVDGWLAADHRVTDIEQAHAAALVEHRDFCERERHELAYAETLAAADWPDHAFDWSEED